MPDWAPKFLRCLHDYNGKTLAPDLVAGLTVGLVALPLAMAFAISSGVKPEAGMCRYCLGEFRGESRINKQRPVPISARGSD